MDGKLIRILLMGADTDDAYWLRTLLTEVGTPHVEVVQDELAFTRPGQPREGEYDLILFILSPADSAGLNLLSEVRKRVIQRPIIALTGPAEEAVTLEIIRRGANDCLNREKIDGQLLTRSIRYAIERQRAEAALRTREAQFRKVIANNADGIIIVDRDGIIQFANPVVEALLNRPAEDLLDTMFGYPIVVGEFTEIHILNHTGEPTVVEMRVVEIEWEGVAAFLASLRDITERKIAAQEHLELQQERERAQVLRDFLKPAQHDFRTPFTVINFSLAQLRRVIETEQQLEIATRLEAQVARLEQLLLDMLTMSQLDLDTEFDFDRLDINHLLQDIVAEQASHASRKNQKLEFVPGEGISLVVADEALLTRAITNVIVNAVKYTPDGGAVKVKTFEQEQQIVVKVTDTGIGISAEDLPHIYERYYRVDEARGAQTGVGGLGLPITKKIIDRHQGSIAVDSTPGTGTIVRITLPVGQ